MDPDAPNAGRVLGVEAEDACGRPARDFVAAEDAARVSRVLCRFVARGYASGRLRLRLPAGAGRWRDVDVRAINRFDDPSIRGIILNLRDITEFTRVKRELEQRTRQLEARAAEQEGFVREVSHALKTPLASIVAMSEVLEQDAESLGGVWPDGLALIRRVSARMESILSDLLTLARASSGLDELELRPVALDAVLDTAVHELCAQLAGRAAKLEVAGPLPVVLAHEGRLAEVFTALIDNAIKYTPADRHPRVQIGARSAGGTVHCWVSDNGIGIPPDQRQCVFELFRRLDGARALQTNGSGVGLAVVARIIERFGGRIWVEDSPLGGACFRLSLCAASGVGSPARRTGAYSAESTGGRKV
jgi:signal transduction histidine kinase